MMSSKDVMKIINLLEKANCKVWIDGGWGVDALVGSQTRNHDDLDLAIALVDSEKVKGLLTSCGYAVYEDEMPTRLDLRDKNDHRIDLHPLAFDEHGNGLQQLQDGSFGTYPKDGLSGVGSIDGQEVHCLSAELQLKFHLGYEPDENDRHDVALLCEHFGLEVPYRYR